MIPTGPRCCPWRSFRTSPSKPRRIFRVVPEGGERAWPYPSTATQLRQMVDAFGAERVVWGSDFPFVTEECGYERAAEIVANCGAALSPEETEAVMGGTLARMFPGGWF